MRGPRAAGATLALGIVLLAGCGDPPQLHVVRRLRDASVERAQVGYSTVWLARRPATALSWRPGVSTDRAVLELRYLVTESAAASATIRVLREGKRVAEQTSPVSPGALTHSRLEVGAVDADDSLRLLASLRDAGGNAIGGGVRFTAPRLLVPGPAEPNVLILCVDTLRADRLLAGGARKSVMPRVDAWLSRGARFTNAYANANWTLPSIASILTGLVPSLHNAGRRVDLGAATQQLDLEPHPEAGGFRMVIDGKTVRFNGLADGVPSLQRILAGRGYTTAAIHQNGYLDHPIGVLHGFDFVLRYEELDATVGTDRALRWADEHPDTRFALFLHYIDPHQWMLDVDPTSQQVLTRAADRPRVNRSYDARCRHVDAEIDRLLASLARNGVLRNTLVVFLADHGEDLFDDDAFGHGVRHDEPTLRVPLAIFGPGVEPTSVAARVSLVDVAPTILDYLGIRPGTPFSGASLRPLIEHQGAGDRDVRTDFTLYDGGDRASLMAGRWRYVVRQDGGEVLFDLRDASASARDVGPAHPDVLGQMRARFARGEAAGAAMLRAQRSAGGELPRETIDSLRALGYVR
jgi:arylsulfatase A-like enzyme